MSDFNFKNLIRLKSYQIIIVIFCCFISHNDINGHLTEPFDRSKIEPAKAGNHQNEEIIERKITIIVGDDASSIVSDDTNTLLTATTTKSPAKIDLQHNSNKVPSQRKPKRANHSEEETLNSDELKEAEYKIDKYTKVIYIDKSNESGLLIGEIKGENEDKSNKDSKSKYFPHLTTSTFKSQRSKGNPTNFSVYLISRHKEHLAVLIDVEKIDFEPIVNCEYQELRFSVVGEISNQLLQRRQQVNLTVDEDSHSGNIDLNKDEFTNEELNYERSNSEIDSNEQNSDESYNSPPLPVSEAIAMLLNAPFNKTILEDSIDNDFRLIDATLDYIYDETCLNLQQLGIRTESKIESKSIPTPTSKPTIRSTTIRSQLKTKLKAKARTRETGGKQRHQMRKRGQRKKQDPKCNQASQQFQDLMAIKLNSYFEWDDLKIVCGKTKQLLIPMRSFKISVYSDEFAPNSKFVLRYKFIDDPALLPGHDNGKYYCRNRNVIELDLKCNGIDDCGDASDESIKVCGYPSARSQSEQQQQSINQKQHRTSGSSHSPDWSKQKRLTYFNGDVLHCCQSNDWVSVTAQGQANQMANLQSLIGDTMKLFSGPLFAPTKQTLRTENQAKQRKLHRVKRIVGGSVASKGAWPGQASLQYELFEPLCHICAGTLIHPMYVLTAAHCITKDGLNDRGLKVVFGAHDLRQLNGSQIQVRYVDDAQIYPGVDVKRLSFDWENDMNNDIALLRLNAPVLITPQVAPACLPPFNTPLAVNTSCRSIGWGQTHGSGSSNLLKHLSLKIAESSKCSNEFLDKDTNDQAGKKPSLSRWSSVSNDFELSNIDTYSNHTMVCVNNDQGHGICQGDSGGPLYCDRKTPSGEYCTEIYGVASFIIQYTSVGAMCAVENQSGIFGEVSSKTEWISSTIKMFEQAYRLKYSQ